MRRYLAILVCGLTVSASVWAQTGLIPFKEAGQYGYKDLTGKVVVPARFERTFPHKEGMGRFSHQGKFGYLDAAGKLAIANVFTEAFDFQEGIARTKDGPVWGFIDKRGNTIFTVAGEKVSDFVNGMAIFSRNGFYGYINQKGQEVFPPILTLADNFMNGVARIAVGQFYGLINTQGDLVLEPKYDYVGIPQDTVIRVKTGGYWYIYNLKGQKRVLAKESLSGEFSEGLCVVRVIDASLIIWRNYMDYKGEVVIDNNFIWAGNFSGGVAVVKAEHGGLERYGVINREGRYLVDPIYTKTLGTYSEGLLGVEKSGKWGYIDSRGNEVIGFNFTRVEPFRNGYAMAGKGEHKWGLINAKGETIIPFKYDLVMEGSYFFFAVLGHYHSFYSKSGTLIWEEKPETE